MSGDMKRACDTIASMKRIVTIGGSSQPGNYTFKALKVVNEALRAQQCEVDTFDGANLSLDFPGRPLTPDGEQLRAAVREAAGVVLATPEYHGGISALIKLSIENLGFPSMLAGKPVALLGVAAGRIGAVKSLEQLRSICGHVGALVVPGATSIANVRQAFDAEGRVKDAATEEALRGLASSLTAFMQNYICPKYVLEAAVRGEAAPPWPAIVT